MLRIRRFNIAKLTGSGPDFEAYIKNILRVFPANIKKSSQDCRLQGVEFILGARIDFYCPGLKLICVDASNSVYVIHCSELEVMK